MGKEYMRIINEAQSVADNVVAFAEKVFGDIEDELYKSGGTKGIISLHYPFYGQEITVIAFLYYFNNNEDYENWRDSKEIQGYFDGEDTTINTYLGVINGHIVHEQLNNLVHELEHAYQFCLQKTKNSRFSGENPPLYSLNPTLPTSQGAKWFALAVEQTLYVLDPSEQDAYLQEFYWECKNNPELLENLDGTTMGMILSNCKDTLFLMGKAINEPNMRGFFEQYQQIGYSPQKLLKHCQNQYKRLLSKFRKVYGRLKAETIQQATQNEAVVHRVTEMVMRRLRCMR